MTIEGRHHQLDSSDVAEPAQVLVAAAQGKYVQEWQQDRDEAVSQPIVSTPPEVSVVVPTRNEQENIWPLLEALQAALGGLRVEVIFVDDSDDDTPAVIEDAARTMSSSLFHIALEHRVAGGARAGGLATAVVHGMNRAQAEYVAVVDADLQDFPEQLRMFYDQVAGHDADLVAEPTQVLVAAAREKYIQRWQQLFVAAAQEKYVQEWPRDEDEAVSQPIVSTTPEVSVVVPTRNEQENIWPLLEALQSALGGLRVEVIFVDDSDDDTPGVIEDAARTVSSSRFHIELEHRVAGGARAGGLATAVVHGMNRAQAEYVAVIDADLQHPPEQLRVFYDQAVAQDADLVVASRYIKGGSYRGLDGVGRRFISVGLKWTAKLLFPEQLLRISDPLGGFFLLRRSLLAKVSLHPIGYKILLELLIRCQWRQVLEVPYHFRPRAHGHSKANMQQGILVLQHMLRLWREVPAAGRLWKISILILLNVLISLALFNINKSFPWVWANLNIVVYGVMACLDFVLFNRFILPSPIVTSSVAPSAPSLMSIEDMETVELPSAQDAITYGYHLYSIEEVETVELPLTELVVTSPSI